MEESKLFCKKKDASKVAASHAWDAWCEGFAPESPRSRQEGLNDADVCSASSSSVSQGSELGDCANSASQNLDSANAVRADNLKKTTRSCHNKMFQKHLKEDGSLVNGNYYASQTLENTKCVSRKRRNYGYFEDEIDINDRRIALNNRVAFPKDSNEKSRKGTIQDGDSASKLDIASYLLGERSGFEKGVQQAKLDHETISSLSSKLKDLRICFLSDKERLKHVESMAKNFETSLSMYKDSQKIIDQRLPKIESELSQLISRVEEISSLPEKLMLLKDKIFEVENFQCRQASLSAISNNSFKISRSATNIGYFIASNLGKMDYIVSLFARKILFENIQSVNVSIQSNGFKVKKEENVDYENGKERKKIYSGMHFDKQSLRIRTRNFFAVILLIFSFEAIFYCHRKFRSKLSSSLKLLTFPVHNGLSVVRFLLWASLFLIGSQELKRVCFSIAEAFVRGIFRIPKYFGTKASGSGLDSDS